MLKHPLKVACGLVPLLLTVTGLVAGTAVLTSAPSTQASSYPVLCISRTVPGDPTPYEVCVYSPI